MKLMNLNSLLSYQIFLYGCIVFTPIFSGSLYLKLTGLVILLFTAMILSYRSLTIAKSSLVAIILIAAFYFYALFLFAIGHSSAALGRYANLFGFLAPLAIFYLVGPNFTKHEFRRNAVLVVVFVVLVNVSFNVKSLLEDPRLLVRMNFVDTSAEQYFNIGNTLQSAVWVFLGLILLQARHVDSRVKFSVFFVVAIYCLIASKTTNLLLFTACLLVGFAGRASMRIRLRSIPAIVVVSFVCSYSFIAYVPVLESAGYFDELFPRVAALYELVFYGLSSAETARFELALVSMDTFLSNPLFGVGYDFVDLKGDASNAIASGVGHHSEVIDFLARFGLIGVILALLILRPYAASLVSLCDKRYWLLPPFMFLISYSFLNNIISFEFGFAAFVIFPIIAFQKSPGLR